MGKTLIILTSFFLLYLTCFSQVENDSSHCWDGEAKAKEVNGKIEVSVFVKGNLGHMVQFSIDSLNWQNANNGINRTTLVMPIVNRCQVIYYKIPELDNIPKSGCVLYMPDYIINKEYSRDQNIQAYLSPTVVSEKTTYEIINFTQKADTTIPQESFSKIFDLIRQVDTKKP
jgi:hypothetical protein